MRETRSRRTSEAFVRSLFALAIAALVLAASASAAGRTVTLSVPASTTFLDTGVKLARDETAMIAASGLISYGSLNPSCSGSNISADGCAAEQICPVKGGCGALVGRVGGGAPFIVGAEDTVRGSGTLYLGINDQPGDYGDNTGAFSVTITTGPRELIGKVLSVRSGGLYLRHAGSDRVQALHAGDAIYLGDELLTGSNGQVLLEFTIGGRIALGSQADVTVTGERSVNGAHGSAEDTGLQFHWSGAGGASGSNVEIQTNGGVLGGIKG